MSDERTTFETTPVRPMDCLSESWDLLGDAFWLFVGITFVGILLASLVPFSILTGPLFCGIFFCWFRRMNGKAVTFEMLFRGFDYFVESLVATMILFAAQMAVLIPCLIPFAVVIAVAAPSANDNPDLFGFILIIAMLIFALFIFTVVTLIWTFALFTYPLIVDRGLKSVPALKTSYRAVKANFGGIIGLLTIISIIALAAMLMCYLPVFLVAPWCFGAVAIAYRRIFPDLRTKPHEEAETPHQTLENPTS